MGMLSGTVTQIEKLFALKVVHENAMGSAPTLDKEARWFKMLVYATSSDFAALEKKVTDYLLDGPARTSALDNGFGREDAFYEMSWGKLFSVAECFRLLFIRERKRTLACGRYYA